MTDMLMDVSQNVDKQYMHVLNQRNQFFDKIVKPFGKAIAQVENMENLNSTLYK